MKDAENTTPAVVLENADASNRGHDERKLGRKLVYCLKCKAKKPARGGWPAPCLTTSAEKRKMYG